MQHTKAASTIIRIAVASVMGSPQNSFSCLRSALMRLTAIWQYFSSISIPIQRRFRRSQATAVVPDPKNGSRIELLDLNKFNISVAHFKGFGQGWPSSILSGIIVAVITSVPLLHPLPHIAIGSKLLKPTGDLPMQAGLCHAKIHFQGSIKAY